MLRLRTSRSGGTQPGATGSVTDKGRRKRGWPFYIFGPTCEDGTPARGVPVGARQMLNAGHSHPRIHHSLIPFQHSQFSIP